MNFSRFYFTERFDTEPEDFEINFRGDDAAVRFHVDGVPYIFLAVEKTFEENWIGTSYEISFRTDKEGEKVSYDLTGSSKNVMKVFGAVGNILKTWVKKERPEKFFFVGDEQRKRLYKLLARDLEKELPEYEMEYREPIEDIIIFLFQKK